MTYIDISERKRGFDSEKAVNHLHSIQRRVARDLERDGWCSYKFHDLPIEASRFDAFPEFFKKCTSDLPPDPYDSSGLRYRRHGKYLYQPDNDLLVPINREYDSLGAPKTVLMQAAEYQPEHGNEQRRLPGIIDPVLSSHEMRALILADLRIALWSGVVPKSPAYCVGVHIQRLEPRGQSAAVITPNLSHRDGDLSTFVHLLERRNVTGGLNGVTTLNGVGFPPAQIPDGELLAEFELDDVGSGFAVDDRRVGHFLDAVRLKDPNKYGCRTAMLIDFCPSRWIYSAEA